MKDSLRRPHLKTPHTGPAAIYIRAAKLCSSTSETYCNDLKPMIHEVQKKGRTIVTIIADSGPDWSTASLLNAIFFMRLWRDCNLDMLCICSYAARFSANNPIEHLWAPMSKKLNSVRISAIAEGDNKPPCQLTSLSSEEQKKKEVEVFNRVITELCTTHWKDATFDSFPVIAIPVSSEDHSSSDHDRIHEFLKAPLGRLKQYPDLLEEMKFMLAHIQRHRNEIVYMKCQNPTCEHCTNNPPTATEFFSQEKLFSPMPSQLHEGHYCTFLEMCSKLPNELGILDCGMPSAANSDLKSCPDCPAYVFLSKTASHTTVATEWMQAVFVVRIFRPSISFENTEK